MTTKKIEQAYVLEELGWNKSTGGEGRGGPVVWLYEVKSLRGKG
jgi:hypothetical protein